MNLSRRYISKLNRKKAWNAYRLYGSYQRSRRKGVPSMRGLPMAMSIEPTTACNLGCPECPSGLRSFTRPTGNLQQSLFNPLIDSVASHLVHLTFYFQGEPFIHRKFLDMARYASKRGIFTSTSTNAHFIDQSVAEEVVHSGLDRVIISIDGTSQETYEQYRKGGKLEKVLAGTEALIEARKKWNKGPEIIFQFLVVRHNEHQIDDVKALGKKMGVDQVSLKTAQIYDFEQGSPLMPQNEKYSRYKQRADGRYVIKNPLLDQCWRMWSSCVITWDGRVVPCCFDKDAQHVLGNVQESSLSDIWHGQSYQSFRQAILRSRSEIDICKNCSEGTRVWHD